MEKYELLFSPFKIKNIELANRITMAPMFVGYANPDGTVNSLVLNHYKKMGCSGAALIVVENVCIDATGLGSPFTVSYTHLRAHETVLDLVCRLLLEKKKNKTKTTNNTRNKHRLQLLTK